MDLDADVRICSRLSIISSGWLLLDAPRLGVLITRNVQLHIAPKTRNDPGVGICALDYIGARCLQTGGDPSPTTNRWKLTRES